MPLVPDNGLTERSRAPIAWAAAAVVTLVSATVWLTTRLGDLQAGQAQLGATVKDMREDLVEVRQALGLQARSRPPTSRQEEP